MTLELDIKQRVGFHFQPKIDFSAMYSKSTSSVMGNVLTMLSINIFRMFLENVILPFSRTFWELK